MLAQLGVSQGHDAHVDLRPPHHPGRRVGPVPQARARAAARRGRLLRRRLPRHGRALRAGAVAARRQPGRRATQAAAARSRSTSRRSSTCTGCAATSSPTSTRCGWKEPHTHAELDPATYGLTIWDLDREFFTDGLAGRDVMTLGDILGVLRDAYCRTVGVEYMHIQEPDQKRWIQEHVEGVSTDARPPTSSATSSTGSTRPRRSSGSCTPSTWATSASGSRAPRAPSR